MNSQPVLPVGGSNSRIQSLDLLRGIIMVVMAIDHVRVYSGIPAGGPTYGIFFTRWVTNFCAPGFVFFAGCSALLYSVKLGDKNALTKYLLVRGVVLVLLELTVIRFFWMFNFNFAQFTLAGIIWMLGWCMIILSPLVRLPALVVGTVGIFIIFFQFLFQYVPGALPESARAGFGYFWEFIYPSGLKTFSSISVLYVIVPWIGVMAAGYGFGKVFLMDAARRRKVCLFVGYASIVIFLVFAIIFTLQHKPARPGTPFLLRVLNQRKYPASALFLLMTLGPLIAGIPGAEKAQGWLVRVFVVFGRVPLFYYICHILLIHCGALLINCFREGVFTTERFAIAPYVEVEPGQMWGLGLLYAEFFVVVFILYFLCRAYGRFKSSHPQYKWLRFL